MSLTQIFMQHNAMNYRQTAIHTIYQQEDKPGYILSLDDDVAQEEQHNKGDTYRTHITSKAPCLT